MSTDSARAAKLWIWDSALHEVGGDRDRYGAAEPFAAGLIGEKDAVIVTGGRLLRRCDSASAAGINREEGINTGADERKPNMTAVSYEKVWQLLAPNAENALRDLTEINRRWNRAGMLRTNLEETQCQSKHEKINNAIADGWRVYLVSVLHLEPVSVRRIRSSKLYDPSSAPLIWSSSRSSITNSLSSKNPDLYSVVSGAQLAAQLASDSLLRRVVRMAIRAVYSLGLDLGDAVVALHGSGRTAALSVGQSMDGLTKEEQSVWHETLLRFRDWYAAARDAAGSTETPLLIGADPEFVLLREDGRIVPAERYLGIGGGAGADALVVGRKVQYPIGELRPDPAASPDRLAANVRHQLLRASLRVNDPSLRWAAGAMPVTGAALGGHIHISGVPLTSRLLRQLDRYVALPVAMVEGDHGRGRRPRYGALGDYRIQAHGGFEYRTLPSWLVSPLTAKAAFALTLLCAKDSWELPVMTILEEHVEAAFYEGDRAELLGSLDDIAKELAGSPSYDEFARWIEPLFEAARRGAVWDDSLDIRRKWRVTSSR
ncbi:putative amidoligase domain-containing protein [Paenibacillus xylaniclasticus]|uniref:putative amidoligase domain-containing protein n=1 Tax=Paenibacillus xylaniclasticus TaxID=588083 RepID=UPI000FD866E3|nr:MULTISPECIES: hypothetical protein [Paenibacillus]GFN30791.1 hypothetical protein PCURB6_10510 [Paenibacillus curdlanolyticus]